LKFSSFSPTTSTRPSTISPSDSVRSWAALFGAHEKLEDMLETMPQRARMAHSSDGADGVPSSWGWRAGADDFNAADDAGVMIN